MMLDNLRNPLPGFENAGEMVDTVKKTANRATKAAKDASSQVENWAKDGYGSARDAVKTKPWMLGAASLGFGALMGGLYALWQRGAARKGRTRKTVPVRSRAKQSLRAMSKANGAQARSSRKAKRAAPAGSMDS
jgi:hypothetical protein